MSLVDSLDSILMLYAYATPHMDRKAKRFALFMSDSQSHRANVISEEVVEDIPILPETSISDDLADGNTQQPDVKDTRDQPEEVVGAGSAIVDDRILDVKADTMSTLSIILTVLSILVALR